ncbi:MarR family winged helix-turn-helix transcriptional regulator [Pseudonocardia yunnanensis]|uniref:MarR family winged helix-turn-helix transcriptional regulator n=1 Tax=Pseudonocardia yunnanensis TaxID=58107 RepID=A0ABW4EXR3_9PSEU
MSEQAAKCEAVMASRAAGTQAVELELSAMIGHLLRACQQLHVAIWSEAFPAGLTSPQFAVVHALAVEGELNQTTLRSRARLDRSTAADVIRRLAARRLISHVKDPSDARRRLVRLTNAGRAVHAEAVERALQVNETMLDGLDDARRTQLISLLNALLDNHRGLLGYRNDD